MSTHTPAAELSDAEISIEVEVIEFALARSPTRSTMLTARLRELIGERTRRDDSAEPTTQRE